MTARFGVFTLLLDARRLVCDGRDLHLTPKAFDLLSALIDAAPRVMTKTELHVRLWPDTFVSDSTLVGLVKEVRRALGDTGRQHPVIRTVMRVGYGIAIPVHRDAPRLATAHWLVGNGQSFRLSQGVTVIGRAPTCGVCLEASGVSRRHAIITVADDEARVEDAASKNGTTVNGELVTGSAVLREGDLIAIGSVPLVYRVSSLGDSTETRPTRAGATPARSA